MTDLPALELGPMPSSREMSTIDERLVHAPLASIFALAVDVERWPAILPHYRFVRFQERRRDGGGIVDMSANRPFGLIQWPTCWRSKMQVQVATPGSPTIRFTHIAGVTSGMEVEWTFGETAAGTHVRIVHLWNGPSVPVVGSVAATMVIGPVFVHGIASRTLEGLAKHAERGTIGTAHRQQA
ncbi:MAG: SRPBCC family protein [Gemmatimonadota bacterium]|nr:SRPBCC family protein [Gemmatimonadota bacterium]